MKKGFETKQLVTRLKGQVAPLTRHFYFIFIMLLITGVGISVYYVASTFNYTDEGYRTEKQLEFADDVQLRRNDNVVDKVLQRQTANSGPIQPNYVPSRDNPFKE